MERSSSAELSLTLPTAVHVDPLSVEYCQVPVPLVKPVTAIPFTAPVSTSVTFAAMSDDTRLPPFVVWSSVMFVKFTAPVRTGASLTAFTVILLVAVVVLYAVVPPLVAVLTFVPAVPVAWSQARKVTDAAVPF